MSDKTPNKPTKKAGTTLKQKRVAKQTKRNSTAEETRRHGG